MAKIPQQNVIDINTKKLLRFGYCNFQKDGSYNPETEEIILRERQFPGFPETEYFYDPEIGKFEAG